MVVALLLSLMQASIGLSTVDSGALDAAVLDGIRQGVYPGAALVIGRHDTILFAKSYGHFTWNPGSATVSSDSTLWDVASLTKVVATTPAMMLLVEQGKVVLDSPVVRYVPEFNSLGTGAITVRHLLTHTSGLRATLPLREAADSAAALRMVLTTVPIARPGTQMVYSDLKPLSVNIGP